jgi:hypothetical protein
VGCSADIVLEDGKGGAVPTIVLTLEHTSFEHTETEIAVRLDREQAQLLAMSLLVAMTQQSDIYAGTYEEKWRHG